ncbi:MAG: hypothetical protein AAFY71_17345 [Bacteroidota bacterium]
MRILIPIILLSLFTTLVCEAQYIEPCRKSFSKVNTATVLETKQVNAGNTLYLSSSYLSSLEKGEFEGVPSGLIYHQYVRPASKKELKGEFEGESEEVLADDGNIYIPFIGESSTHFFQKNKAFKGKYAPEWEDPNMVIPLGLTPLDMRGYVGKKFSVKKVEDDYILFDVEGKDIVFYLGFPTLDKVFDSQEVLDYLAEKQEEGKELLGEAWYVAPSDPIKFRSESELTAPSELFYTAPMMEFTFDSLKTNKQQTVFYAEDDSLILDPKSRYTLYHKGCILKQQIAYAEDLLQSYESENIRLNNLFKNEAEEVWAKDQWVKETLMKRFWKLPSRRFKSRYEYVLNSTQPTVGSFVYAQINLDGEYHLISHFASNQGLYHTRVLLFFGNSKDSVQTTRISTRDRRNTREYVHENVIEEIQFDDIADRELVRLIAKNSHRKVRIRFKAGGSYYKDVKLSPYHKEHIRDVYMLSKVIERSEFAKGRDE